MGVSVCDLAKATPPVRAASSAAQPAAHRSLPASSASPATSASSEVAGTAPPATSARQPAVRPASPPSPTPEPPLPLPAGRARVHLFVDHPGAWLELRNYVDEGAWRRVCFAPCNRVLAVDGMDARVRAPGMTTSNVFRITAGRGTARLKVAGGSAEARTLGVVGLAAGIPVSLTGIGLYGYGVFKERSGFKAAGMTTLVIGAVSVIAALPLLIVGSTRVHDSRGKAIASEPPLTFHF